jgi:hypothetical protein
MAKVATLKRPRSVLGEKVAHSMTLAQGGIETDQKLFRLIEAVIADLGADKITTQKASALSNAVGKVLKLVELKYRYGKATVEGGQKTLQLT